MNRRLAALAGVGLLSTGCLGVESDPPFVEDSPGACEVPDEYDVLDDRYIVMGDIIVGLLDELRADCAAGRPWRGPYGARGGKRGIGVSSAAALWPNGEVVYDIDDTLPNPTRVTDAIAQWEAATTIQFRQRSNETDYVYFTNGSTCSSAVGKVGNEQDIVLSTGQSPSRIVGSGISSVGTVYTWFDNGLVASGTSSDLDSVRAQYSYTLPGAYSGSQIVGMAIAQSNDHVFTWYSDGRFSEGTSANLEAYAAPRGYTLPPNWSASQIVEIDIAPDGRVYSWFSDGVSNHKTSIGTANDLDSIQAPAPFVPATGRTVAEIRGMAISITARVYTWYSAGVASVGNAGDLDAFTTPYSFSTPGGCPVSAVVHEIGHAVGLHHEQNRCNRNDEVHVYYDNIEPGKSGNFAENCSAASQNIGAYNDTSVMHYGSYAFSTNGVPTILRNVPAGEYVPAASAVEMSVAGSGQVYTWWTDGTVTAGTSSDLEFYRAREPFSLPPTYQVSDIVGIGIAKSTGHVFTYFRDGKRSVGTSTDLDAISGPVSYTLPGGLTPFSIFAIDIATTGHVYVWYINGQVSSGTTTNLGAYSLGWFTITTGHNWGQVLGIGIWPGTDLVSTWFSSGETSVGTSTDLDANGAPYLFSGQRGLIYPSPTLNQGDIDAINVLY